MTDTVAINVSFSTVWVIAGLLLLFGASMLLTQKSSRGVGMFSVSALIWFGAVLWLIYYVMSVGLTVSAVRADAGLWLPAIAAIGGLVLGVLAVLIRVFRK